MAQVGFTGELTVHVYSAVNIAAHDFNGFSDPYCVVKSETSEAHTKVIWKNLNPEWNESLTIALTNSTSIRLVVMDKDMVSFDDLCGSVTVDLTQFAHLSIGAKIDLELKLDPQGVIKIALEFMDKSNLFGYDLTRVCQREHRAIPIIIDKCIRFLDSAGLDQEGLYRVSGNAREIDALRAEFIENPSSTKVRMLSPPALLMCDRQLDDSSPYAVNNVAALLKRYLRELPEPLIPDRCLPPLLAATSAATDAEKKAFISQALSESLVTVCHASVIRAVFRHLSLVAQHSDKNRMTVENLAICFMPTLFNELNTSNAKDDLVRVAQLLMRNTALLENGEMWF